jgi:DNA polymerase
MSLDLDDLPSCTACSLFEHAHNVVPGAGSGISGLMLVGLGPGYSEDLAGAPFVGPAGKLLDRLLGMIRLSREEVYITNRVKHLPVDNKPTPEQVAACEHWLRLEIQQVRPSVGILLGQVAASYAFPGMSMHECNGLWTSKEGITWTTTYHPAAVLRGQRELITTIATVLAQANSLATWLRRQPSVQSI